MSYTIMYGSLADAEAYFATRLNTDAWDNATFADQTKALCTASRMIDRLNFNGTVTTPGQPQEFPRGGDVSVPQDIIIATYEIGLAVLDGYDPEIEVMNQGVETSILTGAKSVQDTTIILDHIRAGIPSVIAWGYLVPYIRDSR